MTLKRAVVIVGLGNPDRGDDAAGRMVARRLQEAGAVAADIIELKGETTSILFALENTNAAFLVDACASGAPAGAVRRFDAGDGLPTTTAFGFSSHGFGLAEAIELGNTLAALPSRCIVYAIEGQCFEMGAPVSDPVARAIEEVAGKVTEEICALLKIG
jgi:hydrogenase maturation protease